MWEEHQVWVCVAEGGTCTGPVRSEAASCPSCPDPRCPHLSRGCGRSAHVRAVATPACGVSEPHTAMLTAGVLLLTP